MGGGSVAAGAMQGLGGAVRARGSDWRQRFWLIGGNVGFGRPGLVNAVGDVVEERKEMMLRRAQEIHDVLNDLV